MNPNVIKNLEESIEAPAEGLSVDAAWDHKSHAMEYRGVWLHSGKVAFELGPFYSGSNNLGEFMAIVHGLRYLNRKGLDYPVYSDSQTAISWVRNRRVTSRSASLGLLSSDVYSRMTRLLT